MKYIFLDVFGIVMGFLGIVASLWLGQYYHYLAFPLVFASSSLMFGFSYYNLKEALDSNRRIK